MATHSKDGRGDVLNMRIDPKLKFLAGAAARSKKQSLSEFIERALKLALSEEAMMEREATPGMQPSIQEESPLWNEHLWDEDEAKRVFKAATHDCLLLLTPSQQRMWANVSAALTKDKKKLSMGNFATYYAALIATEE